MTWYKTHLNQGIIIDIYNRSGKANCCKFKPFNYKRKLFYKFTPINSRYIKIFKKMMILYLFLFFYLDIWAIFICWDISD